MTSDLKYDKDVVPQVMDIEGVNFHRWMVHFILQINTHMD